MNTRRATRIAAMLLVIGYCAACSAPAPDESAQAADPTADPARRVLEERLAQVKADEEKIGGFRVVSTRYRHEAQKNGWQRPMLDLVLQNGTALQVSSFSVVLTLASPGREEPWLHQDFRVLIKGQVEPGQQYQTTLTPSPDSPWGLVQAPPGATMQVELLWAETPTGERYLGPASFGSKEQAELDSLTADAE